MKRHTFTLFPLPDGEPFRITHPELVHQMQRVLKLRIGEEIWLMDGQGKRAGYEIVGQDALGVSVRKIKQEESLPDPEKGERGGILCCAILKKDHFDWVVEKATEVGISEIVPLLTDRTIKKEIRLDRLRKIAQEAAEQSERAHVPLVHEPMSVKSLIPFLRSQSVEPVFFDTQAKSIWTRKKEKRYAPLIGPEGGWSEAERQFLADCTVEAVSLGKGVLRGETAAIIASYLVSADL
jgi:16S rRNA (uracil1498-N3)-methyltransferase